MKYPVSLHAEGELSYKPIAQPRQEIALNSQGKTFRTVFRMIDHEAFCDAFIAWASQWNSGGIVAIDGKTLRGSKDGETQKAQHVLNAFAHESGMCIGQKPVDGKSNEITANPVFLEELVAIP